MRVVTIIIGILTIIVGLLALFVPGLAAFIIAFLMGFLFLAGGVMSIIGYFTEKKGSGWTVFFGIISALAGCLMLVNGFAGVFSVVVLSIIVGVSILFNGISQIMSASQLKKQGVGSTGWLTASGVLSIICGILALINPLVGFFIITFMFSFVMIMQGISMIATGSYSFNNRIQ